MNFHGGFPVNINNNSTSLRTCLIIGKNATPSRKNRKKFTEIALLSQLTLDSSATLIILRLRKSGFLISDNSRRKEHKLAKREIEIIHLDKRAKDRYIKQGRIEKKDYENFLNSLKDVEADGIELETNQSAYLSEREEIRRRREEEQREKEARRERLSHPEVRLGFDEEE